MYLESIYGITLGDDYEVCFESTVKVANILKQTENTSRRGGDLPLKSYVDDKKKVHVEYDIPSVNLSELLILAPEGSGDRARWERFPCSKFSYFEYRGKEK
jgi:hypothetical protein